jgi:hypothetical protein
MMVRLQAEEQLMAVNATALGSGSVEKGDARRTLDALERTARAGRGKRPKATPPVLAAMGIGVVEQNRPAEAGDV